MQYWYDGQLWKKDTISLPINDPGLLYGATVFTTLRVYQRSLEHPLTQWNAHCSRLETTLKEFDWSLPHWEKLYQGAQHLICLYPVLRLTIFPNGKEWITGRFLPENLALYRQQGSQGWLADYPLFKRTLAPYKTGNYLGAWLARQQGINLGFQEAILVNEQGNWLETTTGNLWGWKEGKWYTPTLNLGILPGIGRSQLMSWLSQKNIAIEENRWTTSWAKSLKIIAYTNSVVEVVPFNLIDVNGERLTFDVTHHALQELYDYYDQLRDK